MNRRAFEVRPFDAGDVAAAAALQRLIFPGMAVRPDAEIARKLHALYLESPFCVPGLSTVAVDEEDRYVGFRGVLMRSWLLRGVPQVACTGTGVSVHPEMRRRGVAHSMVEYSRAEIRARGLHYDFHLADRPAGNQIALSYGASNGDEHLAAYAFGWALPLRSGLRGLLRRVLGRGGKAPGLEAGALASQDLEADSLAEALAAVGAERPLHLAPDRDALRWLLDYMADYPSRGRFEARVLSDGSGPVGFFAGYLRAGSFEVTAFAATREHEGPVRSRMLYEARAYGAQRATGDATAWNLRALLELGAKIRPGTPLAFRESTDEVRQLFRAGDSLLTGLEGEAWI